MSKSLWWVPVATGLQNGVNPCLLITAALVLLGLLWFKRAGIHRAWIILLIVSIIVSSFTFNCGFHDKIVLNSYFEIIARCVYAVLGILVGLKGLKFLNEWFLLLKGKEIKSQAPVELRLSAITLIVIIPLMGFLLSMLASVWPVSFYMVVFSAYMAMPGQLIPLGLLILLYTALSLWIVYLVIGVSFLESKNQRLFKIIAAAILLSASLGVLDIVFMKG